MSIRLRLTLLFSAILAVTLLGFSAAVYAIQAESTVAFHRRALAEMAQGFARRYQSLGQSPTDLPPPALRPEENAPEDGRLRRADDMYTQILGPEGEVIWRSENLAEAGLPVSVAGLAATAAGRAWVGLVRVDGDAYLTHLEPVIIDHELAAVLQLARPLADRERQLATLRTILLTGSSVAIAAAFAVGWFFAGVMLRPIDRLTQTAQAIGAERDFDQRVEYAGPNDEVGRLAGTFNRMLTELRSAYQQVERSLHEQRQFVADVSHELRTPLTTLRGNLALLRRSPAISPDEQSDVLDDMVSESDRLIRLVNDLLTLARAEASRTLRREPCLVKPLVQDACRQAETLAPARTIGCTEVADVAVVGDPDALKQILLILLDNALKYACGPITLTALATDGSVAIGIQDAGPGIGPELLPHVFERFYRGDSARTVAGIGLGLPIAKALTEAQGGTITVESEPACGSVVTVTFPRHHLQS